MNKNWLLKSGWLHGLFIALIIYPLFGVVDRYIASITNVNLLVYTVLYILTSSFALLLLAGKGPLSYETLKRPETWVYGATQIASAFFAILVLKYVSATEGAVLFKVGALFLYCMSIVFLNQTTNKKEILGNLLILLSVILVIAFSTLDQKTKGMVIFILIIRSLMQAIQKFIAETHKTNRKANNFKDEIRVTGFIMSISGIILLTFLILTALIQDYYGFYISDKIPNLADFIISPKVFCIGLLVGLVFYSSSKYCEFYASKTIGSKYLMALSSSSVFILMIIERVLANFGVLEPRLYELKDYIPLFLVSIGSLLIVFSGFKLTKSYAKKGENYNSLANSNEANIEDEEMLETLSKMIKSAYYQLDKDMSKLADLCQKDEYDLEKMMEKGYKSIKRKDYNKIQKSLREVANEDALTGALTRFAIYQIIEENISKNICFMVFFIDLNKFKPINDKYGHEVGDLVLIETAKRLKSELKAGSKVARLGGDEYVIMMLNIISSKSIEIVEEINEIISKPHKIKGFSKDGPVITLEVGASIGFARFPADGKTREELLKHADTDMYKNKKSIE